MDVWIETRSSEMMIFQGDLTMNVSVHQRIRTLIEETNDAFCDSEGAINADYAEFATLALADFKSVLSAPKLTKQELIDLLRTAMHKHKDKDPLNWAAFMAYHIASTANKSHMGAVAIEKGKENP